MTTFSSDDEHISLFCRLAPATTANLPIRSSEMGMLIYLCSDSKEHTPMEVSRYFKVGRAMVTNMATSLSAHGYLEKLPSPTDGRSVILHPTDKARNLVRTNYSKYHRTIQDLHYGLGDAKFAQLIELLKESNSILLEESTHE